MMVKPELLHRGGQIQFECGLLYYPPSPSWHVRLDTQVQLDELTLQAILPLMPERKPKGTGAVTGRWICGNGRAVVSDESGESVWEELFIGPQKVEYRSRLPLANKKRILAECHKVLAKFNQEATRIKLVDAFVDRQLALYRERTTANG